MSQHTLVTILGKVINKEYNSNYRPANYAFSNTEHIESRFFGLALCQRIKAEKLVVLGTTGSMWDNLLLEAKLLDANEELLEPFSELEQAAQEDNVSQELLDFFATHLEKLLNIPCALRLIPYGQNADEQMKTLEIVVNEFNQYDTATLDVTHGLRHLPMLVQQSALLLQNLKHVTINNIYYGALELTKQGMTPVMKINGLIEIDRWNQALNSHDKDGDYAVFAPLLHKTLHETMHSETLVNDLKTAAFYEQTNNVAQARGKLKVFLSALRKEEKDASPVLSLFLPALKERFSWVKGDKLWIRQREVAWLNVENDNFSRACIYGFEAFITKLVQNNQGNPDSHNERGKAKTAFEDKRPKEKWKYYKLLRDIRNQLAHSNTHTKGEVVAAVSSQQELKSTLQNIFTILIPHEPSKK